MMERLHSAFYPMGPSVPSVEPFCLLWASVASPFSSCRWRAEAGGLLLLVIFVSQEKKKKRKTFCRAKNFPIPVCNPIP